MVAVFTINNYFIVLSNKLGLISLIPSGGTSKKMLSLRFTPLCHLLFHAHTSYARNA